MKHERKQLSVCAALAGAVMTIGAALTGAVAADKYRVVYVMSDNLGDKGFNDSAAARLSCMPGPVKMIA